MGHDIVLASVPVAAPLLMAALLAAIGGYLPRRAVDVLALLTTALVLVVCCLLVAGSAKQPIVYWFGNWMPDPNPASGTHFPVGICFTIDPIGAALAALVALMSLAAFTFSWAYFEEVKSLYHALMLVFIAAMCGLCLTGDLFNLFVWFELMTAAAVALCGYKSEESRPLLGALNFAVVNTVGAFLSLGGVALLYAQTGTLNMAEAGRSLATHPAGTAFLLVTFLFTISGFLVKAAVVPFQFWLADAHAVAPTPVCVLFSGVMVELGLYAVARLHWVVFSTAMTPAAEHAVRDTFLVMGVLTALVGAIYCFGQRHLKRMLAFSTVSHLGLMVLGFALLDPGALSGTAVYLVSHGLIKGALFLGAGILLHRCGSVDEHDLRGSGGNLKLLGIILAVGAIGLAGIPPFGTFYGQSRMHDVMKELHLSGLSVASVIAEALTAAAVLRFTARVFLGWGERREATGHGAPHIPMDKETAAMHDRTPLFMWLPAVCLLLLGIILAVPKPFRTAVETAAHEFQQPRALIAATLDTAPLPAPAIVPAPSAGFSLENGIVLLIILALLVLSLFPQMLGRRVNRLFGVGLIALMRPLRNLQSGDIGDYIALFALGVAVYGGLLFLWGR